MTKTVLFWNFNIEKGEALQKLSTESDKSDVIARVVREYEVDILALAECQLSDELLVDSLRTVDPGFEQALPPHIRIRFFTRFPGADLQAWHSDGRIDVRRLMLGGYIDILLAAFHYHDRRNYPTPDKRRSNLAPHLETLKEAERKAHHDRLVVFGDFNMNPFEIGMLDPASGLGAMITRDLAAAHGDRTGGEPSRFYNPMWSIMGRAEAPGTYYWNDRSDPENPYWHCIDGVLLRPSLYASFQDEDLRIIRRITGAAGEKVDLIRRAKIHWQVTYSDHLPILFKLHLQKREPVEKEGGHE
jgi:endonuclease/exonuclease/phosphatase family metal-dependent hydrolase